MSTRGGVLAILFGAFVLIAVCLFFGFLCFVASKRIVDILGDNMFSDRATSIDGQVYIVDFVGILANAVTIHLIDGDDDGDDCRNK